MSLKNFGKILSWTLLSILIQIKDKQKGQKERIPISPRLAKLVHTTVQELGNEILPAANAFDKLYVTAKKENFPIDMVLNDRVKLKKLLGIEDNL